MTTDAQRGNIFVRQVAERIRVAREEVGLTQDEFARKFGCKDRQTISTIETGVRPVSKVEIASIATILDKPMSFFTDPYVVTDRKAFSYRAKSNSKDIDAFEQKAHKLISANHRFRKLLGEPDVPFGNQLKGINKQTPLRVAAEAGERVADCLDLGEIPALKLRDAAEKQLRVRVLFVEAPESISGAACHLQDGDYVIINRNEPSFRRNFNLGHELFHILTWTAMPPARVDSILQGAARSKVEKLADNFASGLLIPSKPLKSRWDVRDPGQDLQEWIITTAKEFRVSGDALYWRLVTTGLLSKTAGIDRGQLSRCDEDDRNGKPNSYNFEFVRRLYSVLENGFVSVRKAAELLDCEPHDLKDLVLAYGFDPTY